MTKLLDTRNDVLKFMQAGDQVDFGLHSKQANLYFNLITEELIHETLKAFDRNDLVEIADGIADSIWVIEGFIITVVGQTSLDKIWSEILEQKRVVSSVNKELIFCDILYHYSQMRKSFQRVVCYKENVINLSSFSEILSCLVVFSKTLNIPLQEVWDEVARSNHSKISENGKVIKNEFGKIQKPETFSPANIKFILQKHNLLKV